MSNNFRQQACSAARLGRFLLQAGSRYQVHSPFLYSLISEVIRPNKSVAGEEHIETVRRLFLNSSEIIRKTDFGTGAGNNDSKTYPVPIRQVARTSLASRSEARRLHRLANFTKAGRIIEIGTSLGITTAYLASANPKAKIITLEGCPELSKKARQNFQQLGLENIELIEGRFEDTLKKALETLGGLDLVFVDGNHRREAVLDYFLTCHAFANNDTIMVFDDIHASDGMEDAWNTIKKNDAVRVSLDLFFSGWILFRKESSREHYKLRYI